MEYKLSEFNIAMKDRDGSTVYFNTIRRIPVKISAENREIVEELLNNIYKDNIDSDLLNKLKQGGLVVPSNVNERDIPDYEFNKIIYSDRKLDLTIVPTDACNFDCTYCYQTEPYHRMSKEVMDGLLKYLERNIKYYSSLVINWFGGEPLLEKETIKYIMKEVHTICKKNGVAFIGRMTTNGSRLDIDTFNELVQHHVLYYQITIDGTEDIHNKQRPLKNGGESYKLIMDNLETIRDNAKSNRFQIKIRVNVTRELLGHMNEFLYYYKSKFSKDRRFTCSWELVKDWGGEKVQEVKDNILSDQRDFFNKLDEALEQDINFYIGVARNQDEWLCAACRKNGFLLNYDGKLHKCTLALYDENEFNRISNEVGVIRPNGQMLLNEDKIAVWMRDNRTEVCNQCKYYPLCHGVECPYALIFKGVDKCRRIDFIKNNMEKEVRMLCKKEEVIYI